MAEEIGNYILKEKLQDVIEESDRVSSFKIRMDLKNVPQQLKAMVKAVTKVSIEQKT